MDSLLERIKSGSKNHKLIYWPGNKEQVIIKVLSVQERQEAAFCTERLFKSEKIEPSFLTSDEYADENATQILFRALRDPKNMDAPITENISKFRALVTREEKTGLLNEYLAFENECAPSPDNLSNDEFDRIIESIKKNPELIFTDNYSIGMLKKLLHFMVSLPVAVQLPS